VKIDLWRLTHNMNSKNIKFIAFIIALLILGFFFSSELTQVKNFLFKITGPVSSRFLSVSDSVGGFFKNIKEIGSLSRENARLLKENNEVKASISELQEVNHENEILKKELGFIQSHMERVLIPSRVINRSPTSYFQTMRIDKGTDDGVEIKKAVLSEGYLIGIVEEVGKDYSEVSLITNNSSLVPVVLEESRGTGLLKGGLKGLSIENITLDTEIKKGENVITSGMGGELPAGISIGNVTEIISSKSEIFQRATVKSPIELGKIEFVFVIK